MNREQYRSCARELVKIAEERTLRGMDMPRGFKPTTINKLRDKVIPRKKGNREIDPVDKPLTHALKTMGAGTLGFVGGYGTGYLAMEGLNRLRKGKPLPVSSKALSVGIPLAGAAAGMLYNTWKHEEEKELRRALRSYEQRKDLKLPK